MFAELLRSPLKTVEPGFFTKPMSYQVRKHKEKRGSMYSFTCYLHKHMQKIVPWRTLGTFTFRLIKTNLADENKKMFLIHILFTGGLRVVHILIAVFIVPSHILYNPAAGDTDVLYNTLSLLYRCIRLS